jgi:hypothetical protein
MTIAVMAHFLYIGMTDQNQYGLMQLKNLWIIAGMAVITSVQSCSKPCGCIDEPILKSGDVLVAGSAPFPGGPDVAAYWVNGVLQRFTNLRQSWATGIAVSGKDVYVIGDTSNSIMETGSVYWKNGVKMTLNGLRPAASSIFVSGTDVYITGSVASANGTSAAVYWKNGVIYTLTSKPGETTVATSGFVSGTDVYIVGGAISNNAGSAGAVNAVYWKNGAPVMLPSSGTLSNANTIFVSGPDVYIGGSSTSGNGGISVATLWKNGTPNYLDPKNSSIGAITVSGNDVYAVGVIAPGTSGYWKNGIAVSLPGFSPSFGNVVTSSVAVSGQDVYIGGQSASQATLWKNGVETKLAEGSGITSIFIVP